MHEYGITKQILKISTEAAKNYPNSRITDIFVLVGELTGFIGESIQMYFNEISKDTNAEGATIHINMVPAKMFCSRCNAKFDKTKGSFNCPKCGEIGVPTDVGKEFCVENIEIETQT